MNTMNTETIIIRAVPGPSPTFVAVRVGPRGETALASGAYGRTRYFADAECAAQAARRRWPGVPVTA